MLLNICYYFLYFIIYSIIGWILEVSYTLITKRKFINRGFLIGPYCPIYGCGLLLILLLVDGINTNFVVKFFLIAFICSVLEYIASYVMEKLFKARWWDYTKDKFNINGRVCLETFIEFGLAGTLALYFVHPFVSEKLSLLNTNVIYILTVILLIIFVTDNCISYNVLNKIKNKIKKEAKDNTEEINKKIEQWIKNNNYLYRRIKKAFPKFLIELKKPEEVIKEIKDKVKEKLDE